MKIAALLFILTLPFVAFAESASVNVPTVKCTLSSGDNSHSQQVKLEPNKEDMELTDSGYVYDLSFDLIATCGPTNCDISVTFYSGKIEDEVGQTGWLIAPLTKKPGVFFSEKLEKSSDGRDYRFTCEFLK